MKDGEFKILNHRCESYEVFSRGTTVEKNYSPDYVLKCENKFILIEHETQPNRKTIVANIFKASHFLQKEKIGILIIVLTPKKPSSFISYPKHVQQYFSWLKSRTNLEDVIFIHQDEYYKNETLLILNGEEFNRNSVSLNNMKIEMGIA